MISLIHKEKVRIRQKKIERKKKTSGTGRGPALPYQREGGFIEDTAPKRKAPMKCQEEMRGALGGGRKLGSVFEWEGGKARFMAFHREGQL